MCPYQIVSRLFLFIALKATRNTLGEINCVREVAKLVT